MKNFKRKSVFVLVTFAIGLNSWGFLGSSDKKKAKQEWRAAINEFNAIFALRNDERGSYYQSVAEINERIGKIKKLKEDALLPLETIYSELLEIKSEVEKEKKMIIDDSKELRQLSSALESESFKGINSFFNKLKEDMSLYITMEELSRVKKLSNNHTTESNENLLIMKDEFKRVEEGLKIIPKMSVNIDERIALMKKFITDVNSNAQREVKFMDDLQVSLTSMINSNDSLRMRLASEVKNLRKEVVSEKAVRNADAYYKPAAFSRCPRRTREGVCAAAH